MPIRKKSGNLLYAPRKTDYDNNTINHINNNTAGFADKLGIKDKLRKLNNKNASILFKDHKRYFTNKKQGRLINPTKTEFRLVAKTYY